MKTKFVHNECGRIRLDENEKPIHNAKSGWPLCRDCRYWISAKSKKKICSCYNSPYYCHYTGMLVFCENFEDEYCNAEA